MCWQVNDHLVLLFCCAKIEFDELLRKHFQKVCTAQVWLKIRRLC